MLADELISFLKSKTWRIERLIFDCRNHKQLSFKGTATFLSKNTDNVYEENGELYSDIVYSASRRYIYRISDNLVSVYFDDGRPFYSFDCELLPTVSITHQCGQDEYLGSLFFESESWKIKWDVTGPNKSFSITTSYS